MSKKILSFEEYVRESDRSTEIEQDILDMGQVENLEDEVEDSEEEVEVAENYEEDEDESEEDEDESEEDEDESEEEPKLVSEMLKEIYESACKEAIAYEKDDYEEHTVETYMKEMASLNASMMSEMYTTAYNEAKEGKINRETYEAMCEGMKESYSKKIDELKEEFEINDVDHDNPEGYPSPAGDSDDVE